MAFGNDQDKGDMAVAAAGAAAGTSAKNHLSELAARGVSPRVAGCVGGVGVGAGGAAAAAAVSSSAKNPPGSPTGQRKKKRESTTPSTTTAVAAAEADSGGDTAGASRGMNQEPARARGGTSTRVAAHAASAAITATAKDRWDPQKVLEQGEREATAAAGAGAGKKETSEEEDVDELERQGTGLDAAVLRSLRARFEKWREENTKRVEEVCVYEGMLVIVHGVWGVLWVLCAFVLSGLLSVSYSTVSSVL